MLASCTLLKKAPPLSETEGELPKWIYSPYDGCSEASELCASGEGKSFAQADAEARANLGSIFEVQIQSETNISSSSSQGFPWQGSVKEEVQKSLKESVHQILETVQIKNRYKKDRLSFALASLDRTKAGDLLLNRLEKLDHELALIWGPHQRTNLRRMVKLYMERERLNERYAIVSGQGKTSPVSWQQLMKFKESRPADEPLVLKIGQAPDWMKEKISELLGEAGFRLVRGEAKKMVTVQVDSIKEFMNVSGFEKHTFTLTLTSIMDGEKKRTISTSETVTGRSQSDALLKVKSFFTDYIEQHLSDLQLD